MNRNVEFGVLIFHKKFGFGFSFEHLSPQPRSLAAAPGHSSHVEGTSESGCACDLVRVH